MDKIVSPITWVDPKDCDPPHGLDMEAERDYNKVMMLAEAFEKEGFDKTKSALVGYPLNGKIQLLSGTHRHEAALRTNTKLPVTFWLRSNIEESWGELQEWIKVMRDIPVNELEKMTRKDMENVNSNNKTIL